MLEITMKFFDNVSGHSPENRRHRDTLAIAVLYVLMLAGGLWHILGVLQRPMELLAAPMIAAVALAAVWKALQHWRAALPETQLTPASQRQRFLAWSALVFVLGFCVEFVGERTGLIFGAYSYDSAPFPVLMLPAIGAAWLSTMLGSTAIAQQIERRRTSPLRYVLRALFVATCMAVFDGFMEPAATALHYWAWAQPYSDHPWLIAPLQNYGAWFVVSFLFSLLGSAMRACERELPRFVAHTYWAQLAYFVLVNLR
jgi:uncharacterized membrane protein